MALDFDRLDPTLIRTQVFNVFQPEPGGLIYASYMIEDTIDPGESEDSRVFLLALDPDNDFAHRQIYRSDGVAMDHVTLRPDRHHVLEMPKFVFTVDGAGMANGSLDGDVKPALLPSDNLLNRIWAGRDGAVYLCGQSHEICRMTDTGFETVWEGEDGYMRAMHVEAEGHYVAGGDKGVLVVAGGGPPEPVPLPLGIAIRAVHRDSSGTIHIGCENGQAFLLRDEELITLPPLPSPVLSICEFGGQVYWGTLENGLGILDGTEFVPGAPIGYAYAMNATEHGLIVVSDQTAFLYDGREWRGFVMVYERGPITREIDVSMLNG